MWHIVGSSICDVVWEFLDIGILPKSLNDTLIVLIPKVQDPKQVEQFLLISLCNVVYKAITKGLVNHLKYVLLDIIAPTQCSLFQAGKFQTTLLFFKKLFIQCRPKKGVKG